MKTETPIETAERIVRRELNINPDVPLSARHLLLANTFAAALNAERERAAKIVNDARSEGHADLRELVSRIRGTQ